MTASLSRMHAAAEADGQRLVGAFAGPYTEYEEAVIGEALERHPNPFDAVAAVEVRLPWRKHGSVTVKLFTMRRAAGVHGSSRRFRWRP